jgi:hypothetical protein
VHGDRGGVPGLVAAALIAEEIAAGSTLIEKKAGCGMHRAAIRPPWDNPAGSWAAHSLIVDGKHSGLPGREYTFDGGPQK